jgi:dTMP kinase
MTGRLITLEGVEGAGKTTQLRMLAAGMGADGAEVLALREPGGTALGDEVRRLLLGDHGVPIAPEAEALLFMASRAQIVTEVVRPALARGATVLLDRFFLSTYAYQGAGRGIPLDALRHANRLATGGLRPDLTVLIQLDPGEGLARAAARGGPDRMEGEAAAFHARVSQAFESFAAPVWQRDYPECGPIVAVDGGGPPEEVFARVRAAIERQWPGSFPA